MAAPRPTRSSAQLVDATPCRAPPTARRARRRTCTRRDPWLRAVLGCTPGDAQLHGRRRPQRRRSACAGSSRRTSTPPVRLRRGRSSARVPGRGGRPGSRRTSTTRSLGAASLIFAVAPRSASSLTGVDPLARKRAIERHATWWRTCSPAVTVRWSLDKGIRAPVDYFAGHLTGEGAAMERIETDVLMVGAGPAGLTAAALLARAGVAGADGDEVRHRDLTPRPHHQPAHDRDRCATSASRTG